MDNKNFDVKKYNELVEQIKTENPKIDIEFCKYLAGSYLIYDVMGVEKPNNDLDEFQKASQILKDMSIELEA